MRYFENKWVKVKCYATTEKLACDECSVELVEDLMNSCVFHEMMNMSGSFPTFKTLKLFKVLKTLEMAFSDFVHDTVTR
jgi:hypothetical protein